MRVNLKTLGCRLNEAELETWARQFQADGHRLVDDTDEADLVVFNTCAVTQDAVRKSRNLLRKAVRENPRAKVVVSGCYATLSQGEAETLGVDLVVANSDKHRLVEIAKQKLDLATMPALSTEPGEVALFRLGRQRAFVKVQDGCRHRCTYCIVTVVRGEERSRSLKEIVAEIRAIEADGIQEVVLTGVHLGGYGSDLGLDLRTLVKTVLRETGIARIRMGSLEPWDLPENFAGLFANPRLMPHLHLPLQSGSDAVLKRMARRCKTGEFACLAENLRRHVPDINITTDIIVGFPGETEAEWVETLAFAEQMAFGHIHVFGYSPRAGTAAAEFPNPVHGEVRKTRVRALQDLADRHRRAMLERFIGREFPVLWESARMTEDGRREVQGYTPNFLRAAMTVTPEEELTNRITRVRLKELAITRDHAFAVHGDQADVPACLPVEMADTDRK